MSFKVERVKAGKTITETAEYLDVSRMTLWSWETGKTFPRASRLQEIAKFFDCTVDDLLRDDLKSTKKTVQ